MQGLTSLQISTVEIARSLSNDRPGSLPEGLGQRHLVEEQKAESYDLR